MENCFKLTVWALAKSTDPYITHCIL